MFDLCYTLNCNTPATDEYHFYQYVPALGGEYRVVWMLCDSCCEFACDVVECISNLDNEEERERWK